MATTKPVKKPRVRKAETVRERSIKQTQKAEAKAKRSANTSVVKRFFAAIARLFRKPLRIFGAPFQTRPLRFAGRILGNIFWPPYFRNAWKELRQVTWPGRRETWKLTFAVLVFAVVFGLAAAGTDLVLDKIIRRIVFRS